MSFLLFKSLHTLYDLTSRNIEITFYFFNLNTWGRLILKLVVPKHKRETKLPTSMHL